RRSLHRAAPGRHARLQHAVTGNARGEMRLVLVALAAFVLAAPALADQTPPQGQPLSPPVVPGAGLSGVAGVRASRFRVVHAAGVVPAGTFRIDFAAGPGNKVVLRRGSTQVFRALRFTSMRWAA